MKKKITVNGHVVIPSSHSLQILNPPLISIQIGHQVHQNLFVVTEFGAVSNQIIVVFENEFIHQLLPITNIRKQIKLFFYEFYHRKNLFLFMFMFITANAI